MLEAQPYRTAGIEKIIFEDCSGNESLNSHLFIRTMFRDREPIEKRFKWLLDLKSSFEEEAEVESISLVFAEIDKLVQQANYVELDEVVEVLQNWDLSYEIISNVLRYTFSIRNNIPRWDDSFAYLVSRLEEDGISPEEILVGLR